MRTILLTGFDAFGNETSNPSWEAVSALDGLRIADAQVTVLKLPCVFGESLQLLERHIQALQPEIVLCVGQAGGRVDFSVERVAINLDDARIADNAGAQPIDMPVIVGAPLAYFSSLPLKMTVAALRAQGLPASVSHTAGTYVCNHVFYGLMHYAASSPFLQRAGFLHIPYSPQQAAAHAGAASMALDDMRRGLRIVLASALHVGADLHESGGQTH